MNGRVVALADYRGTPRLRSAVEAFFADKQLSANTRRAYRQALSAVVEDLGLDLSVDQLDSRNLLNVFQERWGSAQPSTWNTRITALQSFVSYCQRNRWIDHDPMSLVVRRREPRDQTKAIPYEDLEELWSRRDIRPERKDAVEDAVRNRRQGRGNPRAQCGRPRPGAQTSGDHRQGWPQRVRVLGLGCRASSFPIPGRATARTRVPHPPATQHHPSPGRRMPAHRPREDCPTNGLPPSIFKQASGGWTLHQLRHSSLTHLGEQGASTILVAVQEQTPRPTHSCYLQPNRETKRVAELTATFDRQRSLAMSRRTLGSLVVRQASGGGHVWRTSAEQIAMVTPRL